MVNTRVIIFVIIIINPQEFLIHVTRHLFIATMHAHLRTVEMLRPAGTVGSAAGLLASTFYQMCNSGHLEEAGESLVGSGNCRSPFSFHPYSLLLVVDEGEICHCHPDITLEISSG